MYPIAQVQEPYSAIRYLVCIYILKKKWRHIALVITQFKKGGTYPIGKDIIFNTTC
jgi:hypothetical protein